MCEQTEINYLDGDIVWVKLQSQWWPGQVVGTEKLPEDVQADLQRKPVIAAVKFFQEDSFEFVKNYHQIYKYNCTQKEDFIKKGLDKYRAKNKDGSNYMDKFPEDVKTAEKLTNGDPNILLSEQFNPKVKPDISNLFGEKKITKKKRNHDDSIKKSDADLKGISYTRFSKEHDGEVRIREHSKSIPSRSTSNSYGDGYYPCHICGYVSTRVNVIIFHLRNHRLNNETSLVGKSRTSVSPKSKVSDSPKRKYVRKSMPVKIKIETKVESSKRKYVKQSEKPNKKKRSDPELREKILADWTEDSDDNEHKELEKSVEGSVDLSDKNLSNIERTIHKTVLKDEPRKGNDDSVDLLQESDKLLQETSSFAKFSHSKDVSSEIDTKNVHNDILEKLDTSSSPVKQRESFYFRKSSTEKSPVQEKDDTKSKLSCFDFDEEDSELNISSVRKVSRSLGNKNISLKKEIIKEFEMSQALKNDIEKEVKSESMDESNPNANIPSTIIHLDKFDDKNDQKVDVQENKNDICETQVEILEIFEVEHENINKEENFKKELEKNEIKDDAIVELNKMEGILEITKEKQKFEFEGKEHAEEQLDKENRSNISESDIFISQNVPVDSIKCSSSVENQEIFSTKLISEIKDVASSSVDSLSDSQNNTDSEILLNFKIVSNDESIVKKDSLNSFNKKRRGRPKKSLLTFGVISDNEPLKSEDLNKKSDIIEADRKTSESDSDRSYSGRKMKPNRKYDSSLYLQDFDCKSPRTDESLSESEYDKLEQTKVKSRKSRKEGNSKSSKLVDNIQNLKSSLSYTDDRSSIEADISDVNTNDVKYTLYQNNLLSTKDVIEQSNNVTLEEQNSVGETVKTLPDDNQELTPPKTSQIKNVELSQTNLLGCNDMNLNQNVQDNLPKINIESDAKVKLTVEPMKIEKKEISIEVSEVSQVPYVLNEETLKGGEVDLCNLIPDSIETDNLQLITKATSKVEKIISPIKISESENDKNVLSMKVSQQKFDNQFDSFQDAFVKGLNMENISKIQNEDKMKNTETGHAEIKINQITLDQVKDSVLPQDSLITSFPVIKTFDGNKDLKTDNSNTQLKSVNMNIESEQSTHKSSNDIALNSLLVTPEITSLKINENSKKLNDLVFLDLPPSSVPDIKVTSIPVKKRDMPRIIENVPLKEPIIFKNKLIEKSKIGKHKLEAETLKSNVFSKTKVMKMETVISNSKNESAALSSNQNFLTSKTKIKTSTTDDLSPIASISNTRNEQVVDVLPQLMSKIAYNDKYLQQSSQNLIDMELDINSMPFVLSEDVLTPESIEKMPVVISSVLSGMNPVTPLSTTLPCLPITSAKEVLSEKDLIEINSKKKSGTPTILKSKSKAKPLITSIKTLNPPLAVSTPYKAGFKGNTPTSKIPVGNQKTPGKYVIVQTSGHQQAYSTHQKGMISTSKGSGNAQIVQHGNKVVILHSPQSGQPINLQTTLSKAGKVQKTITTKQSQTLTSIGAQNIVGAKTTLTRKSGDFGTSAVLSKGAGQKFASSQHVVTSKGVLTQLSGSITKSTVFGTLPQGIITKEGIFTPINASTLGGKPIISSKPILTKAFPPQSISSTKNILNPITQSLGGKTIINPQGIVSKGTILTPITGSQVKALAAKNVKGNKVQLTQSAQSKTSASTQISPKISMSCSSAQIGNIKTSSSMVMIQNSELKYITPNKRDSKQDVQQQASTTTTILSPSKLLLTQQKSKVMPTSSEQKILGSKTGNRITRPHQKVLAKFEESTQVQTSTFTEIPSVQEKMIELQKQPRSTKITNPSKSLNKNVNKKTLNIGNAPKSLNATDLLSMEIPSLNKISHEKIPKKESLVVSITEETTTKFNQNIIVNEVEKVESKISVQPQIMALPTENNDGTQTYVLVTVDEQGQIVPLDNNTLMSLEGTSNLDGSRTLYIDSSSLGESGNMNNIVLQIDDNSLTNLQSPIVTESSPAVVIETLPSSEISQNSNQDILAAALANTDFQHEIGVAEISGSTAIASLTQTSLINQTILQSTIIPPTEPISSPSVLETSLTLNQPIMTPLEVPSNLLIQSELVPVTTAATTVTSTLELPISINNKTIGKDLLLHAPKNSKPKNKVPEESSVNIKTNDTQLLSNTQVVVETKVQNIINETSEKKSKPITDISYTISVPENNFGNSNQNTSSMPVIDDAFNASNGFDSTNASVVVEDSLKNYVTKTSEELLQDLTGNDSSQESSDNFYAKTVSNNETFSLVEEVALEASEIILSNTQDDCISSQNRVTPTIEQLKDKIINDSTECSNEVNKKRLNSNDETKEMYAVTSKTCVEVISSPGIKDFSTEEKKSSNTNVVVTESVKHKENLTLSNKESYCKFESESPSLDTESFSAVVEVDPENLTEIEEEQDNMYKMSKPSLQNDSNSDYKRDCVAEATEISKEAPSQSYNQFLSAVKDITEVPSQSARFDNLQEATQSVTCDTIQTEDNTLSTEPPTQSFEDAKHSGTLQTYSILSKTNTNTPTQSFNEMMDVNEERLLEDECIDDPNFPTQSYEVEKVGRPTENIEINTESNQERNVPSQSNDINVDDIGTSSTYINNTGLNEDETASSSYVPETPENQERDQDQESAISTSSYEIPPCDELNIGSSSLIPDTSVQSEHSSIHDNGVPEIPTSSYSLNPDSSSSTHVGAVPTSSYDDPIIIEQNVSTSYEVPISMASLDESGSRNYVTDSSDSRNEPTSYYPHHHEVSDSYYESMCKRSDSRLGGNSENEEVTPSYYESSVSDITSEASQSYFNQEEVAPSYSNHNISRSYYDPRAEGEASQSFYSTHELNRPSHSPAQIQNVEASQSFYPDNVDEQQQLSQQGEATPAYSESYTLDYASANSPLDRHDLADSSVPARSMDR